MTSDASGGAAAEDEAESVDPFERLLLALRLETQTNGGVAARLTTALLGSRIDLHPHQVEAAMFALSRPLGRGAILADEVGLGKTIEAGLVISETLARGAERILILVPASLRMQWKAEMARFFDIELRIVDRALLRRERSRFTTRGVNVASLTFFANDTNPPEFREADWDLVVIDEAHRLRNVYKPGAKRARRLRELLHGRRKLLLTATPFQNSLMELFGLVSFVDDRLLGSEGSFRGRFLADDRGLESKNVEELRERLGSVVSRTLRRQVRDRIRFTARHSLLFDFAPTPAERHLYEQVSDFLTRARAVAVCFGNRELFLLLCRKILGSSTFAVAATLRRLALTLTERLAGRLDRFDIDVDVDGFEDEIEELGGGRRALPEGVKPRDIESEISELRALAGHAESISVNAKGERLVAALRQVFASARDKGWPEKAVIFTESRRTLEYLHRRLETAGYGGQVTPLHGGSGDHEERDRLVREFRDRTSILLSSEVGAEGLNLQFCNIVVNYDLPWNPQRVEQRIGRCHRYGQSLDVVVVNFLNTDNAADKRLYELLSAKLSLFDGLFGSSDEILGSLESGVGFERRVLEIYQDCRTEEELLEAFSKLEGEIQVPPPGAGEAHALLDGFDDDVRRRLDRRADAIARDIAELQREVRALVLGGAVGSTMAAGVDRWRLEYPPAVVAALPADQAPSLLTFTPTRGEEDDVPMIGPNHRLTRAMARHAVESYGAPHVQDLMVRAGGSEPLSRRRGQRGYWLWFVITPPPVSDDFGAPVESGAADEPWLFDVAILEEPVNRLSEDELAALRAAPRQHVGQSVLGLPEAVREAGLSALGEARVAHAELLAGRAQGVADEERRRLERYATETLAEQRRHLERGESSVARARERLQEIERNPEATASARREARSLVDLLAGQLRHEERLIREDERRRERERTRVLDGLLARESTAGVARLSAIARFWIA